METLWYAEMQWADKWVRVEEGWRTRDECECAVAAWKQQHRHYDDNFRYGFEIVQTDELPMLS